MKQFLAFRKIIVITCSLFLLFLIFDQTSSALWYSGGRSSAFFNAYYDSSVSSYGYTSAFDTARTRWNEVSSSVEVGKTTSSSGLPDKYFVGVTSNPAVIGTHVPYNAYGQVVDNNSLWAFSTVAIYDNTMKLNQMTSTQISSNATHEVGHSLSQDHTTTSASSVMKQGIQSVGVTTYDAMSLISKWGD
ncbi:hypothetical protein [Paenibacillus stellifer]|uniref:hypothetical protein n=1 Tax=Paenibacillus stellifer TaxID=169760 RepID=UPI000A024187|nr:hypothetical protein [Paenibacillus stellifer]